MGTVPISRNSGQPVIPATAGISQTSSRLSLNDRPARGLRWEIPASAGMTYGTLQHYLSEGWGLGDEVLQAVRERFIER